jgi:hypothetical protein
MINSTISIIESRIEEAKAIHTDLSQKIHDLEELQH